MCAAEVPRLVQVQRTYAPGAVVVGVTADPEEDARAFAEEHGVAYPLLADAGGVKEALDVRLIWGSIFYLVDPQGLLAEEGLDDCEQRLAAELAPPPAAEAAEPAE